MAARIQPVVCSSLATLYNDVLSTNSPSLDVIRRPASCYMVTTTDMNLTNSLGLLILYLGICLLLEWPETAPAFWATLHEGIT